MHNTSLPLEADPGAVEPALPTVRDRPLDQMIMARTGVEGPDYPGLPLCAIALTSCLEDRALLSPHSRRTRNDPRPVDLAEPLAAWRQFGRYWPSFSLVPPAMWRM